MIKLEKILRDVKKYLYDEVNLVGLEKENYEWYCDENALNPKHKPNRMEYIKELLKEFKDNLIGLSEEYNDLYSDIIEEVEDYDDEWEYQEYIAKELSHRISNPFTDTYNYMWEPISDAMVEMGYGMDILKHMDITVGHKLVFAFYIQGNDAPLPWAHALDCIA